MLSLEQLTQEALSLPNVSRAALAEKLIESLEFDLDPEIRAAWSAEVRERLEEIRSGAVGLIPGEEALAEVRRLLKQ